MEASTVNLQAELQRWIDNADEAKLQPRGMNAIAAAHNDLSLLTTALWRSTRSQGCPPWSVPGDVFLTGICPHLCTKEETTWRALGSDA